ncbi:MAG: sigma-70 family RNA polymerase sigma factor [Clostridia bacterium]|nr:sigma-70 family RNA polymerase sigma factor [Clostridia bacterium]
MSNFLKTSDEELVRLAKEGDRTATDTLLERYKHVVRARARSFFLAGGETEDLIQEGMVGLYEAINAYNPEKSVKSSFKSFSYLCISRRIMDAVKHAARGKNTPLNDYISIFSPHFDLTGGYSAEEELIRGEDRTEFLQKIGKVLSSFEFQIVVMYVDGMSYAQIAEATGKDTKSIDNALQRSKKKLIQVLMKKE